MKLAPWQWGAVGTVIVLLVMIVAARLGVPPNATIGALCVANAATLRLPFWERALIAVAGVFNLWAATL